MLSVTEARALLISAFQTLPSEDVPLASAIGRVLAAPLVATRDQPPFDSSAMDGFALKSATDVQHFTVVGESAAGHSFPRALRAGEAVRISTGAPLPEGADAVLIQEDARLEGDKLLNVQIASGQHVRRRGLDFGRGDVLLDPGRTLDPVAVALAAASGAASLPCVRKPKITVFATGDEIVSPGAEANDDQIFDSASFAICGFIDSWGGAGVRGEILPDRLADIERALARALKDSDLVVLVGGASVGPHDHARDACTGQGLALTFDQVAVRPGKPTWFAQGASGRVLGLPGNPASAIVCALLFLRLTIEVMLGGDGSKATGVKYAPLAASLPANGARETYLRARINDGGRLHVFEDQDSSLLSVFARANALVLRERGAKAANEGAEAAFLPL